jgi:hypothetical protein
MAFLDFNHSRTRSQDDICEEVKRKMSHSIAAQIGQLEDGEPTTCFILHGFTGEQLGQIDRFVNSFTLD